MRTVIGLTGFAGSGKDEAAKALIEERDFIKVSFAEPLRECMAALNPKVGVSIDMFKSEELRYNDAVERYGYDDAKARFPEMRELLQRFGTEVGRKMFGTNFWVEQARKKINSYPQDQNIVITDVRFPNEVGLIRDFFGVMARVERHGVGAVNEHVSDLGIAFLPVDAMIYNNDTIEHLRRQVLAIADAHSFDIPPVETQMPLPYREAA